MYQHQWRLEVYLNMSPEAVERRHHERSLIQDACVVDEHVNGAEFLLCLVHDLGDFLAVRDVACKVFDLDPVGLTCFFGFGEVFEFEIEDGYVRAGLGERFSDGSSDALAGARDERNFASIGAIESFGRDGVVGRMLERARAVAELCWIHY